MNRLLVTAFVGFICLQVGAMYGMKKTGEVELGESDRMLYRAVDALEVAAVDKLLKDHVDPNGLRFLNVVTTTKGSIEKRIAIAKMLIKAGANINKPNDWQSTPLHLAVINKVPELVALYIESGADTSIPNGEGQTPLGRYLSLHLACRNIATGIALVTSVSPREIFHPNIVQEKLAFAKQHLPDESAVALQALIEQSLKRVSGK